MARNPFGPTYETFVERQIREARERGLFDDLPGTGKPLPEIDPADELWWVRRKMADEGLSYLPPTLVLRKAVEEAMAEALAAPTEAKVRELVGEVNEQIRAANRRRLEGPALGLVPYDVDEVLATWRARRRPA